MATRIAIVGAGLLGNRHLNAVAEDEQDQVACIADPVLSADKQARRCGLPRSWEQTVQEAPAFDAHPTRTAATTWPAPSVPCRLPTMQLSTYDRPEARSWWQSFTEVTRVPLERVDPFAAQPKHVGAVVCEQAESPVTLRDGVLNVWAVEAIHEPTERGHPVHLQPQPR